MTPQRRRSILLPTIALPLLLGCGGQMLRQQAPSESRNGTLHLTIQWPAHTRLIPLSARSIQVTLRANQQVVAAQMVARPTDSESSTEVTFANIPTVDVLLAATAYPNADATGVAQATGSVALHIAAATTTTATLAMDSTIASVSISSPGTAIAVGSDASLSASASDTSGALVLTTPSKWLWASDNPAVATVTASGDAASIHGAAAGTAHISATESESGKSAQMTVTVTASQISFPTFTSASGLTLNGAAALAGNNLRVAPNSSWTVGSAWYAAAVPVSHGFDTTFQFQLSDASNPPADGFAFVVQNAGTDAIGSEAQGVGYGGTYSAAIKDSLAIEFDTYENTDEDDPNANHISIHTRGPDVNDESENYSLGYATSIPTLADGKPHTVRITYAAGKLSVYLDDMTKAALEVNYTFEAGGTYHGGAPAPGLQLNNGKAWVGFTASTGTYVANHDILSWTFTPTP